MDRLRTFTVTANSAPAQDLVGTNPLGPLIHSNMVRIPSELRSERNELPCRSARTRVHLLIFFSLLFLTSHSPYHLVFDKKTPFKLQRKMKTTYASQSHLFPLFPLYFLYFSSSRLVLSNKCAYTHFIYPLSPARLLVRSAV